VLDQHPPGDPGRFDQLAHRLATSDAVGLTVGGDHPLVDASRGFDLDVLVDCEEAGQAVPLLVGEQAGAGVQGPACAVERVVLQPAVAVERLLDTAAAPVQGVTGQADDMEVSL
jgi:hypothetical protein